MYSKMMNKRYETLSKPIQGYLSSCTMGFRYGAILGCYAGGTAGFAIVGAAPFLLAYGLFKTGRRILRK
jgi:hypothetical protein